ncbi:hypothetical protein R1sor_005672 [Riccia sorocarpa]|uniref:Uncharacterized protein n=1 Tax=Riccia sorocarpa TaxID=122646 RepID=A0ABD3HPG6_9MARC
MSFLLVAWAKTTSFLKPPGNTDLRTWESTPICGPSLQAVRNKAIVGKTQGHTTLKEAGITHLQHISDGTGKLRELRDIDANLVHDRKASNEFQKIHHKAAAKASRAVKTQEELNKLDNKFCTKWAVITLDFRILGAALAGSIRPP